MNENSNIIQINNTLLENIDVLSFLISKETVLLAIAHNQTNILTLVHSLRKILSLANHDESLNDFNSILVKYISFIVIPQCTTKTLYSIRSTEYESIILYVNLLHIHFTIIKSTLVSAYSLRKICEMTNKNYKSISPYIQVSIVFTHKPLNSIMAMALIKKNDKATQLTTVYSNIRELNLPKDNFLSLNSSYADGTEQRIKPFKLPTSPNMNYKESEGKGVIQHPFNIKYLSVPDIDGINHLIQLDYYNDYLSIINANKASNKLHYILLDTNRKLFRVDNSIFKKIDTSHKQDIWIPIVNSKGENVLINLEEYELILFKQRANINTNGNNEVDILDFYGHNTTIKMKSEVNLDTYINNNNSPSIKRRRMYVITIAKVYIKDINDTILPTLSSI